jgi:hypothetical protein
MGSATVSGTQCVGVVTTSEGTTLSLRSKYFNIAVYNSKDTEITEDDFMPEQYSYDLDAQKYDYAEGKRQAEAYFFRNAAFPAVAVRVAMVVS